MRFVRDLRSQFLVGKRNGFLPRKEPMVKLPSKFRGLERLLKEMPVTKADGSPGLLSKGELFKASSNVPEYNVSRIKDTRILSALFRDYSFWASAYLLEPCHLNMLRSGKYGLGRDNLPRNIAVPLATLADKLGMKPFMEYATSYALYNWRRKNLKKGIEYDNLELVRAFTGMPSEKGFILVHVAMVAHSPCLVKSCLQILGAAAEKNRLAFDAGLKSFLKTMKKINVVMENMWAKSNPDDYKNFRTFIMGIKNQPMFPNGVIYEGVSTEPQSFRGESGANDSIIPTADNLFQLLERMPQNPLTEILQDFRQYRPSAHTAWLKYVEDRAKQVQVREFAMQSGPSALFYLENLDQIRDFRQRHWNFTQEYILKHTKHPVATGGSPIATWLPNQLATVLAVMRGTARRVKRDELDTKQRARLDDVEAHVATQDSILARQVQILKSRFKQ